MCDECVPRGRALFNALDAETQRLIRLALDSEHDDDQLSKGEDKGAEDQEASDAEAYRRRIVPVRDALTQAVTEAERSTHLNATAVLENLLNAARWCVDHLPPQMPRA